MPSNEVTPIRIERAMEQLRQEREVFNQRKRQESLWFVLRLTMGFSSVLLLFSIIVISALVLFYSQNLPDFTVQAAGVALFADVVGLLIGVWKIVFKPDFLTKLKAETQQELAEETNQHQPLQQGQTSPPDDQGFQQKFGVLWDENYNMRCLNCCKLLKHHSKDSSAYWCSGPGCNAKHVLRDADGNRTTFEEAKTVLTQGSN